MHQYYYYKRIYLFAAAATAANIWKSNSRENIQKEIFSWLYQFQLILNILYYDYWNKYIHLNCDF